MPRVGGPEFGVVEYNGYTFDGAFHIDVSSRDVQDEAGRTTVYTEYTLNVHAILGDAVTTDVEMAAIHSRLTEQNKVLKLSTKGFGAPLLIGGAAGHEIMFGPVPQVLQWRPLGAHLACQVHWSVTFRLKQCATGSNIRGALEANYTIDLSFDEDGNTTERVISGHVILVNHIIGRRITENPDTFRTFIGGQCPLGFKRTFRFHYNDAKNRVDFTIRDREVGSHQNAYPEKISSAEGRHRVDWGFHNKATLRNSMNFKLTPRADTSQIACWLAAMTILNKRIQTQINAQSSGGDPSGVILTSFSIEEDLWGRPTDFSFSWTHFTCINKLLTDSGLYQPIGAANTQNEWTKWRTSMQGWAQSPFGNAAWAFSKNDDVVIDICGPQQGIRINDQVRGYKISNVKPKGLINQIPPPQNSYLNYEQAIAPRLERPTVQQAVLQVPDQARGDEDMNAHHLPNFGSGGGIDTIVQQSSSGVYSLWLLGKAERAGHPIPKPLIQSVGTQAVKEVGGVFEQRLLYNALGVPVYGAAWMLQYVLRNAPGEVKPKANVRQKVDEDGNACSPAP